jgi:hypothetical protein
VWPPDQPEPNQPQLAVLDSTYTSQTACGVAVFNQDSLDGGTGGVVSATFDNVVVTRGGKP